MLNSKKQKRQVARYKKQPESEQILTGITNNKYTLLKNEKHLNEQQKNKLEQVKIVAPVLDRMHELK